MHHVVYSCKAVSTLKPTTAVRYSQMLMSGHEGHGQQCSRTRLAAVAHSHSLGQVSSKLQDSKAGEDMPSGEAYPDWSQ